jgi:ABC-type transporter MlaC component
VSNPQAGLSRIRTEAKSRLKPQDRAMQVDYVVLSSGDDQKLVDVIAEGSSMTRNYYDQFHRMLTTAGQGYAYMVKKLEANLEAKRVGQ